MNILFIINTAAQYYAWKYPILKLREKHNVKVLIRDTGLNIEVIKKDSDIAFHSFKPVKSKIFKYFEIFNHIGQGLKLQRNNKFSLIIGFGIDAALTGTLINKPSIIFTDGEATKIQNFILKYSASSIITPNCFLQDLGKKQVRINGFKELAYLHPNRFIPDPSIINELGINNGQKYIVLRFGSFNALHDIGKRGFTIKEKYELVEKLGKYKKVFISSEGKLPEDLNHLALPTALHRIHHVLAFADMIVSDTGTMITEAAVLGTPAVQYVMNGNIFGNYSELTKYNLLWTFSESRQAIVKALDLVKQSDLKEQWAKNREILLADKIDVSQFMIEFIMNFKKI